MAIDLNQYRDRDQQAKETPEQRKERLSREITYNLESFLHSIFPAGHVSGHEFLIGDIYGSPGDSLSVNVKGKPGIWSDFAEGRDRTGDIFDLVAQVRGTDFKGALDYIEDWLGTGPIDRPTTRPTRHKPAEMGPPAATWEYRDAAGNLICQHNRYNLENGKKEFRPWTPGVGGTFPDPRPLYNQPGLAKAKTVYLVEGEKCADALIGLGFQATTAMGGSNAPPGKTDWRPLIGKTVYIWPDNDAAGETYAQNCHQAISQAGGRVSILKIPDGKPPKWDAADAVVEGFDVKGFLAAARPDRWIDLSEHALGAYSDAPPARQWLVRNVFPLGVASLLAAAGGTGKGMLGLDLAFKVAAGPTGGLFGKHEAFGNTVDASGSAVILSGEDDKDELNRRIIALDPEGNWRNRAKERLFIVPFPNIERQPALMTATKGPELLPAFYHLINELSEIPDLRLVIIDPISVFVPLDLASNPAHGAFAMAAFANMATKLNAAVILCHHINKTSTREPITSPDQARAAIRGTTAIIDGVRAGYALWVADAKTADKAGQERSINPGREGVCNGAVVKANGPADKRIHTYIRNSKTGLLEYSEDNNRENINDIEAMDVLKKDIAKAAELGRPFTRTSKTTSPYYRKHELSKSIRHFSRRKFDYFVEKLLDDGVIVACAYGSTSGKLLDVQGGQFQIGIGKIEPGFFIE